MHHITRGEGIPLLLLHGFCVDHRILLAIDPALSQSAGWRRVYVDLPGMGMSAAGPEIDGADAVAAAVSSFVRDTFGSERFAVLGNSFGGMIARHLVAEFGDQVIGLALLCPVMIADHVQREVPARAVLRRDSELTNTLSAEDASDYTEMAVIESRPNWELFRDHVLPGLRAFDPKAIERISARYALSIQPEECFLHFRGPTVIITGRQDHVVGYSDAIGAMDHYPHATISVLDGAGHNAHLDQPELVFPILDEWVRRMSAHLELPLTT